MGAEGQGFDSRAAQTGHRAIQCCQRLVTGATFHRNCIAQALSRGNGPATRYTLWRNTARIMKIVCFLCAFSVFATCVYVDSCDCFATLLHEFYGAPKNKGSLNLILIECVLFIIKQPIQLLNLQVANAIKMRLKVSQY